MQHIINPEATFSNQALQTRSRMSHQSPVTTIFSTNVTKWAKCIPKKTISFGEKQAEIAYGTEDKECTTNVVFT